jgi:hypothetical protein
MVVIPTRFGVYFVPFGLSNLQRVLRAQGLAASDMSADHPAYQRCLRQLFLLAAQEKLDGTGARTVQDFVSSLRRRGLHRSGPVSAAPCRNRPGPLVG